MIKKIGPSLLLILVFINSVCGQNVKNQNESLPEFFNNEIGFPTIPLWSKFTIEFKEDLIIFYLKAVFYIRLKLQKVSKLPFQYFSNSFKKGEIVKTN